MNPQLLLNSLRVQNDNLDVLIDVLEAEKQAIVQHDYTALENAINEKQKILRNVEREESNRIKIIKDLAGLYSLELPKASVDNLLEQGKIYFEKEYNELEKVRSSIKIKLDVVTRINSRLKDVIEFSRNMIKETIMMLVGNDKHTLVNKKV